ncbi:hypothetical protein [Salidesulfovibrio onnuriiensis]|uniref:hypothetical protein n=1 Tax=Salidesulfovibrio onnuriiensis TaxID=2583823 RepID=UPI0011C855A4|nr:hypothetical protein [Salidesulfovibrio onnuriiensis]
MSTRAVLILTILFLASGCHLAQVEHAESTAPFGSSTRLAVDQQILNPMPAGTEPVRGMDGKYAQTVMEKYQKGPSSQPQKSSNKESLVDVIVGGK